ncbi:alpha-amylase family glycosyl hydrolase [Thiohalocapsa sp. ML1]|uniref:alpha-amylase family glycosyl hydrolase n=1 Tax=Thiohalocapsa sp. ML1 TaxID=1431688 RepID=UPI0007321679|nr:alpha-amylase family glycosyl hydrolase [Thiohalocapsa sp. ML1]
MALVRFVYRTGIAQALLDNARLLGSWDADGRWTDGAWSERPMAPIIADDGRPAFAAELDLVPDPAGRPFRWGVRLDGPGGADQWGIVTQPDDPAATEQVCLLTLPADLPDPGEPIEAVYHLTHAGWLGANKRFSPGSDVPSIRFAVWAPNARAVEVVIGRTWRDGDAERRPLEGLPPAQRSIPPAEIRGGYVHDDGDGAHPDLGPFAMSRGAGGVWETDPADPALASFAAFDHLPYLFRITKDDGQVAYRTDLYARCQIGAGATKPDGPWRGRLLDLDGVRGCSAVIDPDRVTALFEEPVYPEREWLDAADFWADEFDPARPVPRRIEDLVIYELHLGALGFGRPGPGTIADAIALLDHIEGVGANAVELLPMAEFGGGHENWGYATSHYFAIEYGGGGRDKLKFFIRACHRRGIAVIMDVVYNHYVHDGERAQWLYDTNDHARNPYYWYEGAPGDYPAFDAAVAPARQGTGGYLDNLSTGWAPRYGEPMVRKLFASMALSLLEEFHIDGFRVDQTTSIHAYNVLHADGRPVPAANQLGAKLLREWTRTLRLVRPDVMLMAEDHSDWDAVTLPADQGGLGFDAAWYADFYHHLVGDGDGHEDAAKLLKQAGFGDDRPLPMDRFAGALAASGSGKVVYCESHDEAGNGAGTARNIVVAINGAPLTGETRRWAEARCRCVFGITLFSAGTPMFLFGEEVGADAPFLYDRVLDFKPDLHGLREGAGAGMYAFYRDAIALRRRSPALCGRDIEVLHVHNANRVIAFRRWGDGEDWLVIATLGNRPFLAGYEIRHPAIQGGQWQVLLNSDALAYGGGGVGDGRRVVAEDGSITALLPASSLVLLRRG